MTENKGDLISRDALKEHKFIGNKFVQIGGRTNGKTLESINKAYQQGWNDCIDAIIDNAPTVEYTFEEAFQKTVCEQRLYCPQRPQSEWEESHIFSCGKILRMGMNVIEHKCKNCGRWSIKWERTIPDNFCPNCGADMRGEEK